MRRQILSGLLLALLASTVPPGHLVAQPPPPSPARAAYDAGAKAYDADRFAEAARLFHTAYGLEPLPVYLFNAARAEQRGLQLAEAERDYLRLLALPDLPAEMRDRVALHLDEIRTTRAGLQARTAPAWRAPVGVSSVAAGGVAVVVGAVLVGVALADDSALTADLGDKGADGLYRGLDYAAYAARKDGIERNHRLGHGLLWGGAVVAGLGSWIWLGGSKSPAASSTANVRLLPAGQGLVLRGQF
ncbi:MAG: hypothetical protein H6747_15730 [Deltaproteobacteria bacterium]|nr:hypothetical protein [Deltaproteobacteria bacterium]